MPFISLFDERARPKGSRDPLGFEVTWSHFGRRLVGNLTTITTSATNFKVALLGFVCAHEVSTDSHSVQRAQQVWQGFLRYEQLAAYLRLHGQTDNSLMGVNRAKDRYEQLTEVPHSTLILSDAGSSQILSNQSSYGLWGLYSSAMREAGLIKGDDRTPTDVGQHIVTRMLSSAPALKDKINQRIQSDFKLTWDDLEALSPEFSAMLNNRSVDQELVEQLLTHSHANKEAADLYNRLYKLTEQWLQTADDSSSWVEWRAGFLDSLTNHSNDTDLAERARDILRVEPIMVFCNILFDYLRSQHDCPSQDILDKLDTRWQALTEALPEALPIQEFPNRAFLNKALDLAAAKDIDGVIRHILEHNKSVMARRGGAAWVDIDGQGKVRSRVRTERDWLPEPGANLNNIWHYDYFLNAYLGVASTVQAAGLPEKAGVPS